MKNVIALIIFCLCIFGITRVHCYDASPPPHVIADHINQYAWWRWTTKTQQLALCTGTNIHNKPVCVLVPKEYVVIQFINPSE